MASPITPSTGRALSITPGSRVLQTTPLSDDSIWKRLKEAGFDEESIKRRDKAALIAYIAKLEAEIFDLQHHMGLLILENKEFASNCEQIKASSEAADIMHKRDQAAHLSAIAEAKKREESLKKALGVEKECLTSIEKALHEVRAEAAEAKVAAKSKLDEARSMVENAQKKILEAEAKLRTAESLQAEANRFHGAAQRKLQEVEAREDDLSRRITSFKADCDAKEKDFMLERQSLSERQKILQQQHDMLLDRLASLNQREECIFSRSQELNRLEKELEDSRASTEKEHRALKDEKSALELALASLLKREEAVIEREELLKKKEQELLVSQEKLAKKESDGIQKDAVNHESALRMRELEFEAQLENKRKVVDNEIEAKRRAMELREMDLAQQEDLLREKEHDLEVQSKTLVDKEMDVVERSNLLDDREKILITSEKEIELKKALLQNEKEEVNEMQVELQKSWSLLEGERNQVDNAKQKLEAMRSESSELSALLMKLKEELDVVRAQKLEIMDEAEKLQVEKAKFEAEWELIDEKREELRKEAERVAEERVAVAKLLKDERDSLRRERDAIRAQHNHDVESLNREREEFMEKMVFEHSEWFSKIQKERADLFLGIETQKRELENCIERRHEELHSSLREREEAFELEKKTQFQYINALKEKAEKELEQVDVERKRLDAERMEIKLDREQRVNEWAELNNCIEELKVQRQKLEQQRELLRADRKEIDAEIAELKKLGDLKFALDNMAMAQMQHPVREAGGTIIPGRRNLKQQTGIQNAGFNSYKYTAVTNSGTGFNSPMSHPSGLPSHDSARFSWIKRCSELIFRHSDKKPQMKHEASPSISDHDDVSLVSAGKLNSSDRYDGIQTRRKRRVDSTPYEPFDPLLADRPDSGKKMRQQNEVPENAEEAITHSLTSPELNESEDQNRLMLPSRSPEVTDETDVHAEKTDGDAFSGLENIEHLQDLGVESEHDIPRGKGAYSNANVTNGVSSGSEEQKDITQISEQK